MITVAPPGFDARHLAAARAAIDVHGRGLNVVHFIMLPEPQSFADAAACCGPIPIGTARRIPMRCGYPDHRFDVWAIGDARVPDDVPCAACMRRLGIDLLAAHVAWQIERGRYIQTVESRFLDPVLSVKVEASISDQLSPSTSTDTATSET